MGDWKMKTFAPVFSGFYETEFAFEPSYDIKEIFDEKDLPSSLMNHVYCSLDDKIIKEDYKEYYHDVAMKVCEFLEDEISKLMEMTVKVKFEEIHSPREYNFANDSIHIDIETNEKEFMNRIHTFLKLNEKEFCEYIKENYTSCDGFISYYDNDGKVWMEQEEFSAHEIGSILNFLLNHYNKRVYTDMVMYVTENVYIGSYVELNQNFESILNDVKFKNIIKEYNFIENQMKEYCQLMKKNERDYENNLYNIKKEMTKEIEMILED